MAQIMNSLLFCEGFPAGATLVASVGFCPSIRATDCTAVSLPVPTAGRRGGSRALGAISSSIPSVLGSRALLCTPPFNVYAFSITLANSPTHRKQ